MCALCGVLGGSQHWTDAAPRPGVFTRNTDSIERRRERTLRASLANRILALYGLRLADWQGSLFVLSSATGKTEMVEDLTHLWTAAEQLSGRRCDPLDPHIIAALEASS
jgi:hypothetical protein